MSSLFKAAMSSMGSGAVRGMVASSVKEAVSNKIAGVTQAKIAWEVKNWPAARMGFTHFDLPELKAARPPESHPETYRLVLLLYGWWCGMTGLLSWNILSSIILTSTIKGGAHPQLAILYSLVEFGIMSPVGLLTLLKGYHGWAENAGRDKTIVRVSVPIFLLISFVFAIVCTGNVNGLAGLGSSAMFATATAAGTSAGAIGFWKAMMVIESLGWLGCSGVLGWITYIVFLPLITKATESQGP